MKSQTWMLTAVLVAMAAPSSADDLPAAESWAIHGQATFVDQYHPAFHSPYRGPDSLDPGSRGNETVDVTLFAGVSPWNRALIVMPPRSLVTLASPLDIGNRVVPSNPIVVDPLRCR